MVTGASWAAVIVGLAFVVVGLVTGDLTFAKISLLLVPLGSIGLAGHYADQAEHSPVVQQAQHPGVVVLRYRPLRALALLMGFGTACGIAAVLGWRQGLGEEAGYAIGLCVVALLVAASMAGVRRSARLILSADSLRVRLPGLDREFAWDGIIEIGAAETPHGDVITITADRAGIRRHRRDGFASAVWRPSRREPNGPWLVPVDFWGVGSVGLFEALTCLREDPALRDKLSAELLTDLLIHGFESRVLGDSPERG
ncbi:hypothetical protein ACFXK0_20195 [Nocardia sp. NPDC059177]|uniref:hypothetical protein n=1 Tax=Nocardia sp. NPDC059177 TaxID=3346759 RepID=UPI003677B831